MSLKWNLVEWKIPGQMNGYVWNSDYQYFFPLNGTNGNIGIYKRVTFYVSSKSYL